jgi:hypothetical protein
MPAPGLAVRVEGMTDAHAAGVLAIYQAGIDEGNATFETRAPGWEAFTTAHLPGHRFVATVAGQVAGWVAASAVSGGASTPGSWSIRSTSIPAPAARAPATALLGQDGRPGLDPAHPAAPSYHRRSVETPSATAFCRSWTSASIHDW